MYAEKILNNSNKMETDNLLTYESFLNIILNLIENILEQVSLVDTIIKWFSTYMYIMF